MKHRTAAMAILVVANVMDLMDTTVVNVALPAIQADLHATPAHLEWVVGAYTLALAATLITGGRLGDIFGIRRIFLTGLAGVAGPLLGGWLVSSHAFGIGWRAIFMINVPIGIVLALAARTVVPSTRSEHARRLDLPGTILATAGVLCLVFPLIEGRPAGWPLWAWLMLAAAPILLATFAIWQRRAASPLIALELFRNRGYLAGSVVNLCFQAGLVSFFFLFTLYLQQALRYGAFEAGLTGSGSLSALSPGARSRHRWYGASGVD